MNRLPISSQRANRTSPTSRTWRPAVVAALLGVLSYHFVGSLLAVPFFQYAAIVVMLAALAALRLGEQASLLEEAETAIADGRIDEALKLHARIGPSKRSALELTSQEATIALRQNDSAKAIALLSGALALPIPLLHTIFVSNARRRWHARLLAVRALAHAQNGDTKNAERDANEVLESAESTARDHAIAGVARAVVLDQTQRSDEVLTLLATSRLRLLEWTSPFERTIVRRLYATRHARSQSAYRRPDRRATGAASLGDSAWIPSQPASGGAVGPVAVDAISTDPAKRPQSGRRLSPLTKLLKLLLPCAFVGAWIWQDGLTAATRSPLVITLVWLAVPLFFVAIVRRQRHLNERAIAAERALMTDGEDAAKRRYEALVATRGREERAHGHAGLAKLAARRAKFAECLTQCERALAFVSDSGSPALLPSLLAQRSEAQAGLGRGDEAVATLATLRARNPTFHRLASVEHSVRLMNAVRGGDFAQSLAEARARPEGLPLVLTYEVLGDLVRASDPNDLHVDWERIDAELRDSDWLRDWIDAVAPGLRDAVERGSSVGPHPRVGNDVETGLDDGHDSATDVNEAALRFTARRVE